MPETKQPAGPAFARLVEIMARLRAPGGCPWDREQNFDTIKPYLLEETYEVMDAIDAQDWEGLADELGDLLLQAVFFAQMAPRKAASISPIRFSPSTANWSAAIPTSSPMATRKPPMTSSAAGTKSKPSKKKARAQPRPKGLLARRSALAPRFSRSPENRRESRRSRFRLGKHRPGFRQAG